MKTWIIIFAVSVIAIGTTGCSMCCGPYDFDYPNFGGKHQRVDPAYGRVGSIFSDPNAGFGGPSADSNLEPHPEPRSNKPIDDFDPDSELDPEFERLKQQLDDDLEPIDPLQNNGGSEELPDPDGGDSTASRMWPNRPLRSNNNTWR